MSRIDTVLDQVERIRLLVDRLDDGSLRGILDAVVPLVWAELVVDQPGQALRHLHRATRLARGSLAARLHPVRALAFSKVGRMRESLCSAADAEAAALGAGSVDLYSFAQAVKARTLWLCRGPEASLPVIAELDAAPPISSTWHRLIADVTLAEVLLSAGRAEDCGPRLLPWLAADPAQLGCLALVPYTLLSRARLACGDLPAAGGWLDRARRLAGESPLPGALGAVALAEAELLLAEQRPGAAIEPATAAADHFTAAGLVVDSALAVTCLAEALRCDGQLAPARRALGVAKRELADAGAGWLAAQIGRAQCRLGAKLPRPGGRFASAVLTSREREIAGLIATGMSNRAIAADLFLSRRTVDTHVERILRKLGVESRTAVAGAGLFRRRPQ